MGERPLWDLFIDEQISDLSKIVLNIGINGLLQSFETWLRDRKLINIDEEEILRSK
jgi:hypothetical protein